MKNKKSNFGRTERIGFNRNRAERNGTPRGSPQPIPYSKSDNILFTAPSIVYFDEI